MRLKAVQIRGHRVGGVVILLGFGQIQEFCGAAHAVDQAADAVHHLLQRRALAAQGLRLFRLVPDIRVLKLARNFFQTFDLQIEVKDTP